MAQWVSMKDAAHVLNVPQSKLSQLAKKGKITTREDPTDERVRLVDLDELKLMFSQRARPNY